MKVKTFWYCILFTYAINCKVVEAQNLLLNGDFEMFDQCPQKMGELKTCTFWYNPNLSSSPDYYNNCDTSGYVSAHNPITLNGQAYAGIMLFWDKYFNYKEYLQGRLSEPLHQGKKYRISLYIRLDSGSKYFVSNINFCLSDTNLLWQRFVKGYDVTFCNNAITVNQDSLLRNSDKWNYISAEYSASGGELYLTIGQFKNFYSRKTHRKIIKKNIINPFTKHNSAYYFIDGVSVELIK